LNHHPFPPARLAWLVCGLGATFYLFAFFQRIAPSVMTVELMREFAIGGAALGNLSAFYYYSYVAMQVPTGVIADALGPRRLLTAGAVLAGFGTLLFAMAPTIWWANLGRLFIGGSVAVAFICMLKLMAHWFPPRIFALISGLGLSIGIIGAVFGGVPLRLLVESFGWRPVMTGSALLTFARAAAVRLLVRDDPVECGYASHFDAKKAPDESPPGGVWHGVAQVLRFRNAWLLVFVPGGIVGCVLCFGGLLGVPYLATLYGFEQTEAAAAMTLLLVSFAAGAPAFGAFSDRLRRRKLPYALGCGLMLTAWVIVLMFQLPTPVLMFFLTLAGFASGSMILTFAFIKESVPASLGGTASGICNTGVMLGPMLLQPAVGWMLDRHWTGATIGGARVYELAAYHSAFLLLVGRAVLSMLLILFTRETHCRQSA